MDMFLKNPQQLLEELWKDQKVHISKCTAPSSHTLLNASLLKEQFYNQSPFYRSNLRLSTCLVQDNVSGAVSFGCKDLPKAFQILPHNPIDKDYYAQIQGIGMHSQHPLTIYRMQQKNNENVLISWHSGGWLVSYAKTTILFSTLADIQKYSSVDNKYDAVKSIAKQWFALACINAEQFSKVLNQNTLVGRYELATFKWIALIQNYSDSPCIAPNLTINILHSLGLKMEPIELVTQQSIDGVRNFIYESRAEQNHSSFIFFVCNNVCIHLNTLTSIEEKIFQSMKQIVIHKHKQKSLRDRHKKQKQFLPYPMKYYQDILSVVQQLDCKQYDFYTLMKISCYLIQKKCDVKQVKSAIINNHPFINELKSVCLINYGALNCKTVIIYVSVGLPGKTILGSKLEEYFLAADLHFEVLHQTNLESIISRIITPLKQQQTEQQLKHYLLESIFPPSFVRDLKSRLISDDVFYQIMVIQGKNKTEINGNKYSLSWVQIVKGYHYQHQSKLRARLISEKRENLELVTETIEKMKKIQYPKMVQVFESEEETKVGFENDPANKIFNEVTCIISRILNNEKIGDNYCSLIIRLEKVSQIIVQWQDQHVEKLIIESYPAGSKVFLKLQ